jgi:hypothetical protein
MRDVDSICKEGDELRDLLAAQEAIESAQHSQQQPKVDICHSCSVVGCGKPKVVINGREVCIWKRGKRPTV